MIFKKSLPLIMQCMPKFACVCICIFFNYSCDKYDDTEKETIEKKLSIELEGEYEKTNPWISLNAYTGNRSRLWVIIDNDTIVCNDGSFTISKGKIPHSGNIELYSKSKELEWIHVGVTYRKRMNAPSSSDDAYIKIRGFTNNLISLDTTCVMHAYPIDDKINESDYIFKINY